MGFKGIIGIIVLIVALIVGWYLISPIFITKEVQEASPLDTVTAEEPVVNDRMDAMTEAEHDEFEKAVEAMKDVVVEQHEEMPTVATLVSEGTFKPRAHEVEGKALLIAENGKKTLRFEDFDTINGPDLRVYLASDLGIGDSIHLGKLKGTKGNFNYELPEGTDTDKYNKVLVWCEPFGILFSYSMLG